MSSIAVWIVVAIFIVILIIVIGIFLHLRNRNNLVSLTPPTTSGPTGATGPTNFF